MIVKEHIEKCPKLHEAIKLSVLHLIGDQIAVLKSVSKEDVNITEMLEDMPFLTNLKVSIGSFIDYCPFCGIKFDPAKEEDTKQQISNSFAMLKEIEKQVHEIIDRYIPVIKIEQSTFIKRNLLITMGIYGVLDPIIPLMEDIKEIAKDNQDKNDVLIYALKIHKDVKEFLISIKTILGVNEIKPIH